MCVRHARQMSKEAACMHRCMQTFDYCPNVWIWGKQILWFRACIWLQGSDERGRQPEMAVTRDGSDQNELRVNWTEALTTQAFKCIGEGHHEMRSQLSLFSPDIQIHPDFSLTHLLQRHGTHVLLAVRCQLLSPVLTHDVLAYKPRYPASLQKE